MTAIKEQDYSDRDQLTGNIIKSCYYVHTKLGPGFNERIYQNALKTAMDGLELNYIPEKEFQVKFDGNNVGKFRVDF
ncbi:MAG: GxxExxY protein [Elusimicrobiota bacterium]